MEQVWHPVKAIIEAMKQDKMTQADLAARLNWHPTRLSKILTYKQGLDIDDFIEIALAQDRPWDYYFEPPVLTLGRRENLSFRLVGQTAYRPILVAA